MPPTRKPTLCYTLDIRRDYSYDKLHLRIFYANKESIKLLAGGTVGNRAGYGSPEAAKAMGQWFMMLYELGHRFLFAPTSSWQTPIPSITIVWQHYEDSQDGSHSYCSPNFSDIGREYNDIQKSAKFLKKLAKKISKMSGYEGDWAFRDPVDVIDALDALRAKRVVLFKEEDRFRYQSAYLLDPNPRRWLLTDSLWKTFEISR